MDCEISLSGNIAEAPCVWKREDCVATSPGSHCWPCTVVGQNFVWFLGNDMLFRGSDRSRYQLAADDKVVERKVIVLANDDGWYHGCLGEDKLLTPTNTS
jgi:hypothetical protein